MNRPVGYPPNVQQTAQKNDINAVKLIIYKNDFH